MSEGTGHLNEAHYGLVAATEWHGSFQPNNPEQEAAPTANISGATFSQIPCPGFDSPGNVTAAG